MKQFLIVKRQRGTADMGFIFKMFKLAVLISVIYIVQSCVKTTKEERLIRRHTEGMIEHRQPSQPAGQTYVINY